MAQKTGTPTNAQRKIVEKVVARSKSGWTIVPDSIRVDGNTATVRIIMEPIETLIGISLADKKIIWSQG